MNKPETITTFRLSSSLSRRRFLTRTAVGALVSMSATGVMAETISAETTSAEGVIPSDAVISSKPLVLNFHRGGGNSRPENTLETFLWAWNQGIIPECDIQFTRDGIPVMFHDGKLSRLPWELDEEMKKKRIADLDWSVVRTFDVGRYKGEAYANQRIPTLDSVLASMKDFPQRLLYVDEKGLTRENTQLLARLTLQYGIKDQVFFTTGSYDKVRMWNEILPGGKAMLWIGACWGGKCDMPLLERRIDEIRKNKFAGITHLNIHILTNLENEDPFQPSSQFLKAIDAETAAAGVPLQVITWSQGDQPETYKKLIDLGIRGFATDYPEVLLEAVKDLK